MERRLSSSDEEAKSKAKAPTGPAQLKYRIHYDHQAKSLVLRVLEGRVSPTLYLEGKVTSHLIQRSDFGQHFDFKLHPNYQNLAKADLLGGKPDAFVDVSLAPGTHKEMKTKYAKKMFPIFL